MFEIISANYLEVSGILEYKCLKYEYGISNREPEMRLEK